MKVVLINTVDFGSTGKIMLQIAETARKFNYEAYTYSKKWFIPQKKIKNNKVIGSLFFNIIDRIISPITGNDSLHSKMQTNKLIKELEIINPDIIHLHNLHGWFINIKLLFNYIKQKDIPVVWTLHDCWPFTGHCPHFDLINCNKWKTGCYNCKEYKSYPSTLFDNSKKMYKNKKESFLGVNKMTIVTPSNWLAKKVKESFLKEYEVRVINNGIDLNVFNPKNNNSFKEKYNITDKKIILGVSFGWSEKKGLDVFLELSRRLGNEYQIVLVGTNKKIDELLNEHIISIHRTMDQNELVEIYSSADVFVNPTREDNFPTVNIESLACGTPVVTFNTGGSPEIIDFSCGVVIEKDNIDLLINEVKSICDDNKFSKESCIKRAQSFDMYFKFDEYIKLYNESLEGK